MRCEEIFRQICWLEQRLWPDVDGMGEEDESAQLGPQVGLGNGMENGTYRGPMNNAGMNRPMNNGMNMPGPMNGSHVNGNVGTAHMNGNMNNSRMNGNDDTSGADNTSTFQMGTMAQSS